MVGPPSPRVVAVVLAALGLAAGGMAYLAYPSVPGTGGEHQVSQGGELSTQLRSTGASLLYNVVGERTCKDLKTSNESLPEICTYDVDRLVRWKPGTGEREILEVERPEHSFPLPRMTAGGTAVTSAGILEEGESSPRSAPWEDAKARWFEPRAFTGEEAIGYRDGTLTLWPITPDSSPTNVSWEPGSEREKGWVQVFDADPRSAVMGYGSPVGETDGPTPMWIVDLSNGSSRQLGLAPGEWIQGWHFPDSEPAALAESYVIILVHRGDGPWEGAGTTVVRAYDRATLEVAWEHPTKDFFGRVALDVSDTHWVLSFGGPIDGTLAYGTLDGTKDRIVQGPGQAVLVGHHIAYARENRVYVAEVDTLPTASLSWAGGALLMVTGAGAAWLLLPSGPATPGHRCRRCGERLSGDAAFCHRCGHED